MSVYEQSGGAVADMAADEAVAKVLRHTSLAALADQVPQAG